VRQHHQRFARRDLRQPGGLHIGATVGADHAAGDQGLRQRLEHDAAAQLFHHHHALDRAHAQAAVVFADVQARQAQLGQFVVGVAVKAARRDDGAAALEVVALVHPLAHRVAQLFLVVGKIEIHARVSSSAQNGLRDDVALHFVGTAVDGGLAHVEVGRRQRRVGHHAAGEVALPAGFHGFFDEGQAERAGGQHHQLGVALLDLAALDLEQAGDVQRVLARLLGR
jgi:hypothetical protein